MNNIKTPFMLNGFRVIASTVLARYDLVKRSWKERLFSRPWQPRRKFNQVEKQGGEAVIDKKNRIIYASPNAVKALIAEASNNK